MELGPEERYAAAALFTLALHLTQVEGGQNGEPEAAWGQTDDPPTNCNKNATEADQELEIAKWAAFWGWDCYASEGLLDRMYLALGIPEKSWTALKHLPEVGGLSRKERGSYMRVVASYMGMLDAQLPTMHILGRHRSLSGGAHAQASNAPPQSASSNSTVREPAVHAACTSGSGSPGRGGQDEEAARGDLERCGAEEPAERLPNQATQLDPDEAVPCDRGAGREGFPGHGQRFEALLGDSDSDLEEDLAAVHLAEHILVEHRHLGDGQAAAESPLKNPYGPHPQGEVPGGRLHANPHASDRAEPPSQALPAEPPQGSPERPGDPQGSPGGVLSPGRPADGRGPPADESLASSGTGRASQTTTAGERDPHRSPGGSPRGGPAGPASAAPRESPDREENGAGSERNSGDADGELQQEQEGGGGAAEPGDGAPDGDPAFGKAGEGAGASSGEGKVGGGSPRAGQRGGGKGGAPRMPPSPKALGATWELLEGCLFRLGDRPLHDAGDMRQDGEGEEGAGEGTASVETTFPPRVRWYDARQRVALKRVALWLNVPWSKVAAYEQLLAYRLLLPNGHQDTRVPTNAWEIGVRAAKIGATTVGIGALFALSGGLAAPAIAASMGAAIGLAGGSAAMAGGVTSFLATTAGTAMLASGVGAAGGTFAGSRMARRIGRVKEFGFWEVLPLEAGGAADPVTPTTPPPKDGPDAKSSGRGAELSQAGRFPRSHSHAAVRTHSSRHRRSVSHDTATEPRRLLGRSPPRSGKASAWKKPVSGDQVPQGPDSDFASPLAADPFLHSLDDAPATDETELLQLPGSSPRAAGGQSPRQGSSQGTPDGLAGATSHPMHQKRSSTLLDDLGTGDTEMERLLFGEGIVAGEAGRGESPVRDQPDLEASDTKMERLLFGGGAVASAGGRAQALVRDQCTGTLGGHPDPAVPATGSADSGDTQGQLLGPQGSGDSLGASPGWSPMRNRESSASIASGGSQHRIHATDPESERPRHAATPEAPLEGPCKETASPRSPDATASQRSSFSLADLFRPSGRTQNGPRSPAPFPPVRCRDAGHLAPLSRPAVPAGGPQSFVEAPSRVSDLDEASRGQVGRGGDASVLQNMACGGGLPGLGSDSELEELLFGPKAPQEARSCPGGGPLNRKVSRSTRGTESDLEDDLFGPTSPGTTSWPGFYLDQHARQRAGTRGASCQALPDLAGRSVSSGGLVLDRVQLSNGPAGEVSEELPRVPSTERDDPLTAVVPRPVGEGWPDEDSPLHLQEALLQQDQQAEQATSGKEGATSRQSRWAWRVKGKKAEPQLLPAPVSLHKRPEDMRLSVTIGVNGWIKEREDYITMWQGLEGIVKDSELFTLVWESRELKALNSAIISFMAQQAGQEAVKLALTHFFYTGMVAAVAWPVALVSFSQGPPFLRLAQLGPIGLGKPSEVEEVGTQMIDSAWAVVLDRAQKAGQLLAHLLLAGVHGDRPVVLIGYSMGARLVFHCLLELCRHNAKGLVETAVVVGVPVSTRRERWAMARRAVAGRFNQWVQSERLGVGVSVPPVQWIDQGGRWLVSG
eukprot:jgi/Botrbrau1/22006/Bobra.0024s0022.1